MKTALTFLFFAIVFVLAGIATEVVKAEGIETGPDCTFTWTPATTGPPADGYKVFIGATSNDPNAVFNDVGNVTTATCSGIGINTSGQYYARIKAYNVAGDSGFSNEVPFVLVTAVPDAPSLSVQ